MKCAVISTAQYAGAISRWCDLNRKIPVASPQASKLEAEFEAFNAYLARLAEGRRLRSGLAMPPTRPPSRPPVRRP